MYLLQRTMAACRILHPSLTRRAAALHHLPARVLFENHRGRRYRFETGTRPGSGEDPPPDAPPPLFVFPADTPVPADSPVTSSRPAQRTT
jgi:hypothetical protein